MEIIRSVIMDADELNQIANEKFRVERNSWTGGDGAYKDERSVNVEQLDRGFDGC